MKLLVAVTIVGNDRPGIVAAVTKALYDVGCNLEDVTSTILRGHFSMVMIVRTPEDVDAAKLEAALGPVASEMELVATARPVEETEIHFRQPTVMVSVYGADKPGIVAKVTEVLAQAGANITDLTSRVIGSEETPVYALMLEVATDDSDELEESLHHLVKELGVDVSVHPIEPDVL